MWLTNLATDIQEAILFLSRIESGPDTVKEIKVAGRLDPLTQSVVVLFWGVGIFWHTCMIIPVSVLEHSKVASDRWQRRLLAR